jgi:TatD DNase family protein
MTTPLLNKSAGIIQEPKNTPQLPTLIDTHCHLDLDILFSRLNELLSNARTTGVAAFVVPGVHPDGWDRIGHIALKEPDVYPAFGIHPMHSDHATKENLDKLSSIAGRGVAIGEIGLDPAYQVPLERQEQSFRDQLRIATELALPVLVHCRRHFLRTLQILKEEKVSRVGGIMHAYSGSTEMAKEFIRLGFVISLSGTLTWHNAVRPRQLAADLPLSSIVLETDSPDMTPQQFKGQPNQPAWIAETVNIISKIRNMDPTDVATATFMNTKRILPGIIAS